jgi:hypothetical protein|mmetsp:Transcript_2988/g.5677  ORF Transcript_2988/g.5677 Transcript_2988/m.5677 type:complete len:102 (+) Transcript_2988:295-600(+)
MSGLAFKIAQLTAPTAPIEHVDSPLSDYTGSMAPWEGYGCGHLQPSMPQHVRAARRANMFPFSLETHLGGRNLLENGGKGKLEIMGQAGVFPTIYPNGPEG